MRINHTVLTCGPPSPNFLHHLAHLWLNYPPRTHYANPSFGCNKPISHTQNDVFQNYLTLGLLIKKIEWSNGVDLLHIWGFIENFPSPILSLSWLARPPVDPTSVDNPHQNKSWAWAWLTQSHIRVIGCSIVIVNEPMRCGNAVSLFFFLANGGGFPTLWAEPTSPGPRRSQVKPL